MRRQYVEVNCDLCWQDGEQEVPATHTFAAAIAETTVAAPKGAKLVETCEPHAKILLDLKQVLDRVVAFDPARLKNQPVRKVPASGIRVPPPMRDVTVDQATGQVAFGELLPADPPPQLALEAAGGPRHPRPSSSTPTQCRLCSNVQPKKDLAVHVWNVHIGRPRPTIPDTCPTCGMVPPADAKQPRMWIARHRANHHGFDVLDDAYANVPEDQWAPGERDG